MYCTPRTITRGIMAARPSNRDQRQSEVMKAYVSAVAKYGLDGATLEIIAKTAGLSRSLIRHHLGNKAEMSEMLTSHVLGEFDEATSQLITSLPEKRGLETLIKFMTTPYEDSDPELILAFAALTMKCGNDPRLAERIRTSIERFEHALCQLIKTEYPENDKRSIEAVSNGLVSIYFNVVSLESLSFSKNFYKRSRLAMEKLVNSLKKTPQYE